MKKEKEKIETDWYIQAVYAELENRGIEKDIIPDIIGKTGFLQALAEYPEYQLLDSISDAADEIVITALINYVKENKENNDLSNSKKI